MAEGGTGSEPRRWRIVGEDVKSPWAVLAEGPLLNWGESVEVREVGSGHDEQTEGPAVITAHRPEDAGVPFGAAWLPDPRTVAAVVEWFRSDPPPLAAREWCKTAANIIERRFGSSVSGGE
jgi:hypothetical protein